MGSDVHFRATVPGLRLLISLIGWRTRSKLKPVRPELGSIRVHSKRAREKGRASDGRHDSYLALQIYFPSLLFQAPREKKRAASSLITAKEGKSKHFCLTSLLEMFLVQ